MKVVGGCFGEMCDDVGGAFVVAFASCGKHNRVAFDRIEVHRRITEREELVSRLDSRKAWFLLACGHPPEEGLHGLVETEVHFLQELAVDRVDLWIMRATRSQRLLRLAPARPALSTSELHHPDRKSVV